MPRLLMLPSDLYVIQKKLLIVPHFLLKRKMHGLNDAMTGILKS